MSSMSEQDSSEPVQHYRDIKKAIKTSVMAESFLCCRYSFSPYMACGHGCRYCDGRAEKYWVEGSFERDIVVRRNLVETLRNELARLRERAPIAIGSGITDSYQPIESTERLMREAALLLAENPFPVSVLTKSALVLRDVDAWSRVNARGGFALNMTIVTLDDEVRRTFEPGASSIGERLGALKAYHDLGCATGIYAMPLLPYLSDGEEDIRSLCAAAKEVGAGFIMFGGLTLRPGRQKECFMEELRRSHPDLVGPYEELYSEQRASGNSRWEYRNLLGRRIRDVMRDAGIPSLIPHWIYRTRMPLYDELYVLLLHMAELYGNRGARTEGLREATGRYAAWLTGRKREFNRKRRLRQEELEAELRGLFEAGSFAALLGNAKLDSFLRAVALDRQVFDYVTLKLQPA